MINALLGAAVQLGLLVADPSSGAIQANQGHLCLSSSAICPRGLELQTGTPGLASGLGHAGSDRLENLRHRLMTSSLRLAALNRASTQTLQARFAFHTLRYAIAMNNYFRARHSRMDCTVQVAAWTTAIDAAQKANINSYIKDIPPECPLR